ncbi:MAG TPA: MBL fold metallo-hydrolase [Thermoanaerobaculia bacterium]|jgi:beta-lactamase superfamily II metal-dependent hydrolase
MATTVLDEDLVRIWGNVRDPQTGKPKSRVLRLCFWGDELDLVEPAEATDENQKEVRVRVHSYRFRKKEIGVIRKRKERGGKFAPLRLRTGHLLEVTFIDVQQGDATVIRTPDRKLIVVDGGEQKFIARLLASMFPDTTPRTPLEIDSLVITHGDADHFTGLHEVAKAADHTDHRELHARILSYYHNGLVKAAPKDPVSGKSVSEKAAFGKFKQVGKETYAIELWDDPCAAPSKNRPFTDWCAALDRMRVPGKTVVRRLQYGDDDAFAAFRPAVDVQVLGPVVETVDGRPALPFLASSASHTINGHSVVLRLGYGNVHFLLGGDLNTHAEERLRHHIDADPNRTLRSEILKVPHHGSHEFEQAFLDQIHPVVSVVSSGDENAAKEYVHPRANLMAALGRASRGPMPLVYCTELAAFFAYRDFIEPEQHREVDGVLKPLPPTQRRRGFHAFERLVWGAVRVRTDGERVLTAVESASATVKEAYAFRVDTGGNVTGDDFQLL